jgi:hypothetical protein
MQTPAAKEAPTAAEKVRPAQLPLEGLSKGLNLLDISTQEKVKSVSQSLFQATILRGYFGMIQSCPQYFFA